MSTRHRAGSLRHQPDTDRRRWLADDFHIGGSRVLRSSDRDDVTLVGAGITVHEALDAADRLARYGIGARVIDCYSVKPLDAVALHAAVEATGGRVVTVEDHWPEGGLGDAVLDVLAGTGATVSKLAVRTMPGSGKPDELLVEVHRPVGQVDQPRSGSAAARRGLPWRANEEPCHDSRGDLRCDRDRDGPGR